MWTNKFLLQYTYLIVHISINVKYYIVALCRQLYYYISIKLKGGLYNGACAGACPVGAISEGDGVFVIDEAACIECGACTGACPTGSIELDA